MFCPSLALWCLVFCRHLSEIDSCLVGFVWVPVFCVSVPRYHELVYQGRTYVYANKHVRTT